ILVSTNIGNPASLDDNTKLGAGTAFRDIAKRVRGDDVPYPSLQPQGGFLAGLRRLFGGARRSAASGARSPRTSRRRGSSSSRRTTARSARLAASRSSRQGGSPSSSSTSLP